VIEINVLMQSGTVIDKLIIIIKKHLYSTMAFGDTETLRAAQVD